MKAIRKIFIALVAVLSLATFSSCRNKTPPRNRLNEQNFPSIVLWAWERPEDLRDLDPKRFAVAFLAQTLALKGDDVLVNPRQQPLQVLPETKLMAVTRVESAKTTGASSALSNGQEQKLISLILQTLKLERVSAVQIDFDAASSERDFYRALLRDLRAQMPDTVPLSMTALASFCVGDPWLRGLPVDEAVPMIFRMGADDRAIKNLLGSGGDFREPLCQKSYGVALDEPFEMKRDPARRIYVFNHHSWTRDDIASTQTLLK